MEDRARFSRYALFLDIDGTMVDFAETPDAVDLPPDLVPLLDRLHHHLDGAVAVTTGRPIDDIDTLTYPLRLTCGTQHGAEIRLPDGTRERRFARHVPAGWTSQASQICKNIPGSRVERKPYGLALHYRATPASSLKLQAVARNLAACSAGMFEVWQGNMVSELRPTGVTKAMVVHRLMALPPFAGRVPLFIGDEQNDVEAFAAVEALGGVGLMVPADFPQGPAAVRDWLATQLPGT